MDPTTKGAHLAFLLHMHQPLYVDPATGVAALPWARLHGARAYLDVARLLDEHGGVRLTVNFVPSLVAQLEAVAAGARDHWEEVALVPTGAWTESERTFLVERFFSVAWRPNVESRPRYLALLEKRGRSTPPEAMGARAATFTDAELRDLTVLFHLAWLGFAAREGEPELAELERKEKGYDERDLAYVLAVIRRACGRVLALYRKLAERGQIELSASPYYHPIVPLLCDTEAARRALPNATLPPRFAHPEDGRRQIARAKQAHARAFGHEPTGMWPPEGSISPEALAAYRAENVSWLASDEGNLFRALSLSQQADAAASPQAPGAPPFEPGPVDRRLLYRPYRFEGTDLVFRDRELSDRIGFRYADGEARAGVDDLLGRARAAADGSREAGAGAPLVPVILDGENPWEHYPGSGEPFLRALFVEMEKLDRAGTLRPTAIGPYLAETSERTSLSRLHSGSWIDSDFHIWIGDPVKNRAWEKLGTARDRFAERAARGDVGAAALEAARDHLDAASGSDWFWWFGEPFHSAEDSLFDQLFRAHLAAAWRSLGEREPDDLHDPVAPHRPGTALFDRGVRPPRARIRPVVDGRVGSFFEWMGAGRYEVPRGAAMNESPAALALHFGFDREALFVRIDPAPACARRLGAATLSLRVQSRAADRRLLARPGDRALHATPADRPPPPAASRDPGAADEPPTLGAFACREVLELSLPLVEIAGEPGERVSLSIELREGDVLLLRLPREGTLDVRLPDGAYDADHWML